MFTQIKVDYHFTSIFQHFLIPGAHYLQMQEQFFNVPNANICPPPPEPLIKPQNQAFFEDQFSLERGKSSQDSCRRSMEQQTMSFNLSQKDINDYEEQSQIRTEEKGSSLKRSLRELHGSSYQNTKHSLLTKLQRIDRMQKFSQLVRSKEFICDLIVLLLKKSFLEGKMLFVTKCLIFNPKNVNFFLLFYFLKRHDQHDPQSNIKQLRCIINHVLSYMNIRQILN